MKSFLKIIVVLLCLIVSACNSTTAAGDNGAGSNATARNGKLYLRTFMGFGSGLDIDWFYLGNDGKLIKNPKHGADPANIASELQDNADNTGTYTLSKDKLIIHWQGGSTSNWSIEREAGGVISAIDGGIVTQQTALPSTFKLSGSYEAGSVLPNVSAISTMVFSKDGTFKQTNSGAVVTDNATGYSEKKYSGTYTITGNTMAINFNDGKKVIALIAVLGGDTHNLVINKSSFTMLK
jgi:predicted small secreted protein